MRLSAYVLAGDPSWIEASINSYYQAVDKIVVSYDVTGTSWSGTDLDVGECLERISLIDSDRKVVLQPGSYYVAGRPPLESETEQRRIALAQASEDADWVLQLDTDEVVPDLGALLESLVEADAGGFGAMEYPLRQLYQHLRDNIYLERCGRFWNIAADYPGAIAVRPGAAALTHCRQAGDTNLFRVDFRLRSTDPAHPKDAPVHRTVPPQAGILHYSWIRSPAQFKQKVASWGHSADRDWTSVLERWDQSRTHPWRAVMGTPFRPQGAGARLRFSRLPDAASREERLRNGLPC